MLIKSLNAINFRKYNKLVIDDIPESGVISIEGLNESGKTSIGEAICFALFGRTFFLDKTNLHKVVSWGNDVAEVSLTFKTGAGDIYTIWRSVNNKGELKVKLTKNDEHSSDEAEEKTESIIDDENKAEQALSTLMGFDYDAFANSFYLAQRELTSPDPQSDSIKQMAGISAYSKITDDLELSNQRNHESMAELQPQVDSNQTQLDELNLDESWLPELIEAEETLGNEQTGRESLLSSLTENNQAYATNYNSFHSAKKFAGFFGFLGKFTFVVSAILWILWLINKYYPEYLNNFIVTNFTDSFTASFALFAEKWLLPSAIVTLVIALISWMIRKKSKDNIASLNVEASGLAKQLDEGHGYVTTLATTLIPERVVQLLQSRDTDPSTLQILPPREQFNNLTSLISDSEDYRANPESMSKATTLLSDALKQQSGEVSDLGNNILGDISDEKTRADQAGNLRATLHKLNKVIDKCNYTVETQTISMGIMQRAAADSIAKFNQSISEVSAKTLPNFTQNRYSKLKIAEDFSVQIFSDEKKGYMDFDEISSGTQRQVMLSLRIAMSEQLSLNTGNEEQFIFLDEPFAFFDQSRTRATLENLPKISNVINQIWISAQEYPAGITVAKSIKCPENKSELIV